MFRAAVFFLICALAPLAHGGDYTALDRYVAAPDASFRYTLVGTVNSPGIVAYQIDRVSQTWLTTAEVDKPVWHHWVTIYKPDQLTTSTAVLFIDGGDLLHRSAQTGCQLFCDRARDCARRVISSADLSSSRAEPVCANDFRRSPERCGRLRYRRSDSTGPGLSRAVVLHAREPSG